MKVTIDGVEYAPLEVVRGTLTIDATGSHPWDCRCATCVVRRGPTPASEPTPVQRELAKGWHRGALGTCWWRVGRARCDAGAVYWLDGAGDVPGGTSCEAHAEVMGVFASAPTSSKLDWSKLHAEIIAKHGCGTRITTEGGSSATWCTDPCYVAGKCVVATPAPSPRASAGEPQRDGRPCAYEVFNQTPCASPAVTDGEIGLCQTHSPKHPDRRPVPQNAPWYDTPIDARSEPQRDGDTMDLYLEEGRRVDQLRIDLAKQGRHAATWKALAKRRQRERDDMYGAHKLECEARNALEAELAARKAEDIKNHLIRDRWMRELLDAATAELAALKATAVPQPGTPTPYEIVAAYIVDSGTRYERNAAFMGVLNELVGALRRGEAQAAYARGHLNRALEAWKLAPATAVPQREVKCGKPIGGFGLGRVACNRATGHIEACQWDRDREPAPPAPTEPSAPCVDFEDVDGVEYCTACGAWRGMGNPCARRKPVPPTLGEPRP